MTSDAAPLPARRPEPNARIRLDLTVPEAILLYGLACMAHTTGTQAIAGTDDDPATVLTWATCKLYLGLRDTYRSGL